MNKKNKIRPLLNRRADFNMKKTIILIIFIIAFYVISPKIVEGAIKIPEDSIRIRIVPNSNSKEDQKIKRKVKKGIQNTMYNLLKETKDSDNAEKIIKSNLPKIDNEVNEILKRQNYNLDYNIKYGYNYFPEKNYKGIKYEEGYYKSLLITLGEGKGDNWWCVLFPPLCLIEAEENTQVEYKSLVQEILKNYIKR